MRATGRAVALVVALLACSPQTAAPGANTPATLSPATATSARNCDGAADRSFRMNVAPVVADVPGGRRLTLFYGTHTHGALVREDGVTFAHYAGLLAAARNTLPDPSHSLFLGNGDDLQATFCGLRTGGTHVIDAFNAAGLDANTYGFNEVAEDVSGLAPSRVRELVGASRFAWVSANVLELDGRDVYAKAQGARRWLIRDVGGVKVGLTGLIVPEPTPGFTPPSYGRDLVVIDPVNALREVVPQMRQAGAEVVVVLSHMDRATMERVARDTKDIDAIVGSHEGMTASIAVVNGVILTDGYDNMHGLGQLELIVKDGRIVAHAFGIRSTSPSIGGDKAVAAVLARYLGAK